MPEDNALSNVVSTADKNSQSKIGVADKRQEFDSSGEKYIRYSPLFVQVLFGLQKVACISLAIWDYVHTRDLTRFTLLVLAGQIDLSQAKIMLTKVLSEILAKYIAKEISAP